MRSRGGWLAVSTLILVGLLSGGERSEAEESTGADFDGLIALYQTPMTASWRDKTASLPKRATRYRRELERWSHIAASGVEYFDRHPADPLRWDAIAIGYAALKKYVETRRETGDTESFSRGASEYRQWAATDPFLASGIRSRLEGLAQQGFSASDADPVTYAALAYNRIYQLYKNEHPSFAELVYNRGDAMLVDAKLAEARRWIEGIDKRFPGGSPSATSPRHGLFGWNADSLYANATDVYLRMLSRARPFSEYLAEARRLLESPFPSAAVAASGALEEAARYAQRFEVDVVALDGRRIDAKVLQGKVVLVNFWSLECGSCVMELEDLEKLYERYRADGLEVIWVSLDEEHRRQELVEFTRSRKISWPVYFDGRGKQNRLAVRYGIGGARAVYLVSRAGLVVSVNAGGANLERELRRYLNLSLHGASTRPQLTPSLVAFGSDWSYLDTGAAPAPGWTGVGSEPFEDWKCGAAVLGYGNGDETTLVSFGPYLANVQPVTYFRREFELPGALAGKPFLLKVRADDGVAVYVNGKEIGRFNLPAGALGRTTYASRAAAQPEVLVYGPAGLLQTGRNVVAASVHQQDVDSSDLEFDLEMTLRPSQAEKAAAAGQR